MLLGFISLLLTVSQNGLTKICVPPGVLRHMLPCTLKEKDEKESQLPKSHSAFSFPGIARRLLADRLLAEAEAAEEAHPKTSFCSSKVCLLLYLYSSSIDRFIFDFVFFFFFQSKVPLLSLEALHHLHIFIFVLAVVHVTFSVLTVVFGGARVSIPFFLLFIFSINYLLLFRRLYRSVVFVA